MYDKIKETGSELRTTKTIDVQTTNIKRQISSASDGDDLAEAIISFCSYLPATPGSSETLIDKNDIRLMLLDVVRAIANHSKS